MSDPALLGPATAAWFSRTYGQPSPIQQRVWPLIAAGQTVLFSSPTGTGKTLAAFMVPLDRLASGAWPGGQVRVVYVSPLKALNNDIRRNLLEPLAGLEAAFAAAGQAFHPVRVMTRSGDTPERDRRTMRTRPPEILVTTPESLAIMLNQVQAPEFFAGVRLLILDEIHAVMESRRGSLLSVMAEKLALFCPGCQRVGISATVQPVQAAAAFLAGWQDPPEPGSCRPAGSPLAGGPPGTPAAGPASLRPVATVQVKDLKEYRVEICLPRIRPIQEEEEALYWQSLGLELRRLVKARQRTLIFCNSRRVCETLARFINGLESDEPLVYPHHGSLSRELRLVVELGLKEGRLKGIVATSSLELGIDIGDLDQVVLVQAPASTASALQRAGRSGHRPGQASSLLVFPSHGLDSLRCAALARTVLDQELEDLQIPRNPLDVLAQAILAFCLDQVWAEADLLLVIRRSQAFHDLSDQDFASVVDMLLGRYEATRLSELEARLEEVGEPGPVGRQLKARAQARLLLFSRGGSIPGRGAYHMRSSDGANLGELDEEFIWERRKGDRFFLGNRVWEILNIDDQAVTVRPATGYAMLPFWRGEEQDLSYAMSCRVLDLLETAEIHLSRGDGPGLARLLMDHFCLQPEAAASLVDFLAGQRAVAGCLPGHRRLVAEQASLPERPDEILWVIHTFWGNRVNRPFSFLLSRAWKDLTGQDLECYLGNEGLLVVLPRGQSLQELLDRLPRDSSPDSLKAGLREGLWQSAWFAARFRENAGRSLLLGGGFRVRTPLWLLRRRSSRLLSTLSRHPDFPVIRETWRQCLDEELDLPSLIRLLGLLKDGSLRLELVQTTETSAFAQSLLWKHINTLMYQPDSAGGAPLPAAGQEAPAADPGASLWETAFRDTSVLPALEAGVLRQFAERLRPWRGPDPAAGDPAGDLREAVDFLARAKFLPLEEWLVLVAGLPEPGAVHRELVRQGELVTQPAFLRLLAEARAGGLTEAGAARLAGAVQDHLSCSPPRSLGWLAGLLGLAPECLADVLEPLVQEGRLVFGAFSRSAREAWQAGGADPRTRPGTPGQAGAPLDWSQAACLEYCTADNLEYLHRLVRKARRPAVPLLEANQWAAFLGYWQGLGGASAADAAVLRAGLRRLSGYELPAGQWEQAAFPLRFRDWQVAALDSLCLDQGLAWHGSSAASRRVWWTFPQDEWFMPAGLPPSGAGQTPAGNPSPGQSGSPFAAFVRDCWADHRPLSFQELQARTRGTAYERLSAGELEDLLWEGVWEGLVSNRDPAVLRQAIGRRFAGLSLEAVTEGKRRVPSFREWERHRLSRGAWYPVQGEAPADELETGEILRERCRLVLDRYGIVHPRLLQYEMPGFRWRDLGFTFKLMELSGEIEAGYLLKELGPLQYALPEVLTQLRQQLPAPDFWLQPALDPASLCGTGLLAGLPARKAGTLLVWQGSTLLWIWQDSGQLDLAPSGAAAGLPLLRAGLEFLFAELDRLEMAALLGGLAGSGTSGRLTLKKLDGTPAVQARDWLPVLADLGFKRNGANLVRFRPV